MFVWRIAFGTFALVVTSAFAQAAEPSAELNGLQEIAQNFYRSGAFAEALETAEKALVLTLNEFGPESEQAAIQEYGVGITAERAGKLDVAERHYRASVRIREKVYGPDSPAVTQAQAELGNVLLLLGRIEEAEPILKRVLALRSAVVGATWRSCSRSRRRRTRRPTRRCPRARSSSSEARARRSSHRS